jgi:hypothetical protein
LSWHGALYHRRWPCATATDALNRRLNVGSLPAVFDSSTPGEDLNAYVGGYLKEEIRAEGFAADLRGRPARHGGPR